MKEYYRQAIAFLLVWFCSGVTMYSYQAENKILGITFTLLSFLYWFIIGKDTAIFLIVFFKFTNKIATTPT